LDTDNDLIIVNDSITPAVGEITHLSGRLLDANGGPIRDAVVEIWQVDNTGTYLKERESKRNTGYDANFQGFGRFLTDQQVNTIFAPSNRRFIRVDQRHISTLWLERRTRTLDDPTSSRVILVTSATASTRRSATRRRRGRDRRVRADERVAHRRAGGEVRHRPGL
jgi:hypothetical protein